MICESPCIWIDLLQVMLMTMAVITAWPFIVHLCDVVDDLEKRFIESRASRANRD